MRKIIVDAMGGDNAPVETVKGALAAAEDDESLKIILVGDIEKLLHCLQDIGKDNLPKNVEIAQASDVITMEDEPNAIRTKKDASMVVALRMLSEGGGDAVVSAGSTGVLLSGATLIAKRIRGVRRAAIVSVLPTKTEKKLVLLDCGANAECTAEYLMQFAQMGSNYAEKALGIRNPKIGLLNIGAEETKGDALHKEAYKLIGESGLNFVGNIEGRAAFDGEADVLVCDGFSGNIFLKTVEGTASFFTGELKKMFMKNILAKLGALTVKSGIGGLKKKLDYTEVGGSMLLGISKVVIKAHGSSNETAFKNAIKQAAMLADSNIIESIRADIENKAAE